MSEVNKTPDVTDDSIPAAVVKDFIREWRIDCPTGEGPKILDQLESLIPATPETIPDELRTVADNIGADFDADAQRLDELSDRVGDLVEDRDGIAEAYRRRTKEAQDLRRERDSARDEVERFTRERTVKESRTVGLTDPADVPDGEAWVVKVNGQRRVGVRSESAGIGYGTAWATSPAPKNRWWVSDEEVTLITRMAPEVVTDGDAGGTPA